METESSMDVFIAGERTGYEHSKSDIKVVNDLSLNNNSHFKNENRETFLEITNGCQIE